MNIRADQEALWELPERPPERPTRRNRPRVHAPLPRRPKDAQERECEPRCIVCGMPEGRGLCLAPARCAVVCVHAAEPYRAEVCIATTHVTAQLAVGLPGARPGRHLAVVDPCPFCRRRHAHAEAYGVHVRISGCGRLYVVHLARPAMPTSTPTSPPAATPAPISTAAPELIEEPVDHRQLTTARGAAHARQLLARTGRP